MYFRIHHLIAVLALALLASHASAQTASYITFVSGKNQLHLQGFDGTNFVGNDTEHPGLAISGDRVRGWSWDGTTASYIVGESDNKNYLYIRAFDGKRLTDAYKKIPIGTVDSFRGWSWDGRTASYVAYFPPRPGQQVGNTGFGSGAPSKTVIIVRPFDGTNFGKVKTELKISSHDNVRGWSWDGKTAHLVFRDNDGKDKLAIRTFDGVKLGPVTAMVDVASRDVFRGFSYNISPSSNAR